MDVAPSLENDHHHQVVVKLSLPVFLNERARLTAIVLSPSEADHKKAGRKARLEKTFVRKKNYKCNIQQLWWAHCAGTELRSNFISRGK